MGATHVPLALGLLRGADWFDEALRQRLVERGWPRRSRNQSLVFAQLGDDGARIVDVARSLDVTRQSAHVLVHGMVDLGLLALVPDPDDGRARRAVPTDDGAALAADAREELAALEAVLAARVGDDAVAALRRALSRSWGPTPGTD